MTNFCKLILPALITIAIIYGSSAYAKDDDYAPAETHFITSVTEETFHQEVIDSLKPVVLDVCAPEDCSARVAETERLAIHYSGQAKFFQMPTNENKSFIKERLESKNVALPVYIVVVGGYIYIGYKGMTDAQIKAFIDKVLSSN